MSETTRLRKRLGLQFPVVSGLPTALAVAAALLVASGASAQRQEAAPKALEGVGVTEHLGGRVPLGLEFTDESGKPVQLSQYFTPGRPVILTLNYYECPMLCTLQLSGLVAGLKDLSWTPGKQFEIVTVSINPTETPALAKLKKQGYMSQYGRVGAAAGWHFLVGKEANIHALAGAVGFGYEYDEAQHQYAHPAALMMLSPNGEITRYLYGIEYPPNTLKLALVEAGEGKVGTASDQLLLYCFHYDSSSGRYVVAAANVMRLGGAVTLLIVGGWLLVAWLRGRGRHTGEAKGRAAPAPSAGPSK
ncbi:MAG: SCO family protein [Acidobacteriota bacterium]